MITSLPFNGLTMCGLIAALILFAWSLCRVASKEPPAPDGFYERRTPEPQRLRVLDGGRRVFDQDREGLA